jgi:penicillin-binding protein 1B
MRRIFWGSLVLTFPFLLLCTGVVGWQFYHELENEIVARFSSRHWDVPSKIYAEPLFLYPGAHIEEMGLFTRLTRLDYRAVAGAVTGRGEYHYDQKRGELRLALHEAPFPPNRSKVQRISLSLQGGRIAQVVDTDTGTVLRVVELEPEVITSVYDQVWAERRLVKLYDVPSLLVKALLAAEDHRFFEHEGIDLWRIIGAIRANLLAGRTVQGGSTLTQQLVKNFFLSQEKTLGRKMLEVCMATIVEHHYSKLEIIENYLNEIYMGHHGAKGIFGMWEASRVYFGKEPRDLTLGELTILAGIVQRPNYFMPLRHPDRAVQRREYVLQRMRALGDIPEEEYQAARKEKIVRRALPPDENGAPYFADFVRKQLEEHLPTGTLTTAGLRVLTSLDPRLQRFAQEAVRKGVEELEARYPRLRRQKPEEQLQACLVAMQPQTGAVRAMVGGRDYTISQFNRVTQAHRQPGSIFKPVVFLTALMKEREEQQGRFLPTSRVEDEPFSWSFKGQEWTPGNYRKEYLGLVSLRRALELSLNAATARVAQDVGLDPIHDTARALGFVSPLTEYPSLVLGASEVTPFEVAVAFSTLANQGVRVTPVTIKRVLNADGQTLERHGVQVVQAVLPEDAYILTHMLEGVLERGTGRSARQHGFSRPAAGKTGTTNDYGDAWFVGYTPDLVTVVWVGFDQRQSLGLSGAQAALPIWTNFMKRATAGLPETEFVPPPGVVLVSIDPRTGMRATAQCPVVIEEAFLEGVAPTRPCLLHATDVLPIETAPEQSYENRPKSRDERDPRPRPFPGERRPWWRIF